MDGWILAFFVLAAFAGGFVSGFSGFAMGLVVSGVWLHIITPIQTAALIAGYGLLTQGYGILKLRQALNWQNIWPLVLGTTIGIPIGVILLNHINPVYLRSGVGVLLVLYTVYGLARPAFKPMKIGTGSDIAIGVVNGLVGGLTGLGGIVSTISCQWRGWTRDVQRAVFQPVLFAAFVMICISMVAPSRPKRSNCMGWASHSCSPGFGSDSNSTEPSMTRRSAKPFWYFSCLPACHWS